MMRTERLFKALALLAVGAVLLLVGCSAPGGLSTKLGTLEVRVDNAVAKALLPPVSMECASYDLTVTDALLNVIISENITASKTYSGILPGTYTVRLVGLNAAALPIGEGENTAVVAGGDTTPCEVTVAESEGIGTLAVLADWTDYPGAVADPRIESELSYGGGSAADISADWVLGTDLANLTKPNLIRGWYGLAMRLYDDGAGEPSAGFCTLARVVKGQTTSGEILLVPNALTGGFQILIDWDFYDPLTLTANIPAGDVEIYGSSPVQTLTVAGAALYGWWKNGEPQGSGASFEIDPADFIEDSVYRIDVIGWSADGKHAGQLTWTIVKSAFDPALISGSFTGNSGIGYEVCVFNSEYSLIRTLPTITGTGGTSLFEITGLAAGNYLLRICALPKVTGVSAMEWWDEKAAGLADVFAYPLAAPTDFVFGTIDFLMN